jgi:hypothetical protein
VYHALGLRAQELRNQIDWGTLVRYGRFRLSGNGDKVRVADLITRDSAARDNSFVRVSLLNTSLSLSNKLSLLVRSFTGREPELRERARPTSPRNSLRPGTRRVLCRIY